jgi:hypothetical protein
MAKADEMWKAEEAFRESVAREWVAQRLFWERRLRTVAEQAEAPAAESLPKAS